MKLQTDWGWLELEILPAWQWVYHCFPPEFSELSAAPDPEVGVGLRQNISRRSLWFWLEWQE